MDLQNVSCLVWESFKTFTTKITRQYITSLSTVILDEILESNDKLWIKNWRLHLAMFASPRLFDSMVCIIFSHPDTDSSLTHSDQHTDHLVGINFRTVGETIPLYGFLQLLFVFRIIYNKGEG